VDVSKKRAALVKGGFFFVFLVTLVVKQRLLVGKGFDLEREGLGWGDGLMLEEAFSVG